MFYQKQTKTNDSNRNVLLEQTLKIVEKHYRDFAGFVMSYEDFKILWRENKTTLFCYLFFEGTKNQSEGENCIGSENRSQTLTDCISETNIFQDLEMNLWNLSFKNLKEDEFFSSKKMSWKN